MFLSLTILNFLKNKLKNLNGKNCVMMAVKMLAYILTMVFIR